MDKPIIGRFIDPLTDFGFKRLFGSEPDKDLLIEFLNELLKGKKQIADLSYNKNEQSGYVKDSRKAVYDLFCTGQNGEQFIIEVQKVRQEYFRDRCVFYTSALIHEQGPKGSPNWDFKLKEVYLIGIMDFEFDDTHQDNYIHEVALIDTTTKELFYNKLGYIFIELPKFKKPVEGLETELDKWLFVLKNLSNLDKIPVILDKRIFSKLFKIAETANLTKEEHKMYEASLMQKWDYENGIDYAVKTAVKTAEKKIMEKTAKSIKDDKFPIDIIAKYTGLSIEEIEKL